MSQVINKMVDRFLCWELPKNFTPDCGISFCGINELFAVASCLWW